MPSSEAEDPQLISGRLMRRRGSASSMQGMRSLIQGSIQHSFRKSEPQRWLHVSCMQDSHLISKKMMQGIHEQHPT